LKKTAFFILLISILFIGIKNSQSQFLDFGKNKVQYSDFEWYVISTEHFQFYYYKEAKELAKQGAAIAEDCYRILQQKFNHSLIDTVPMIFYATPHHFKQTNTTPGLVPDAVGGFYEFIKGRVVIPYNGSLEDFRHVIQHELVHVFMANKIMNLLDIHGKFEERLPPLWFTEGLAEYWSSKWDTQAEMVLKDAVLHNYIAGLSDWEYFYGTYFMYKLGQKVCEYISEKYGEDKILKLIENFWMEDNFENILKYTIGKDYTEFDKEFLYYLKKKYYPDLSNSDNPSQVTKILPFDGFAHKPVYYKKGNNENIFFIGNRTGYTSLYKYDMIIKGKPDLIIEGESSDEFEQFHFFRTGIDVSKSGLLVFVTQSGETDVLHIYNIEKDKIVATYSFKDIVGIGSPSWSTDEKKITFSCLENSGKSDLYLFDIEKEKLTRLTNDYYDDRDAGFSPDGNYIVFSSDRAGTNGKKYNLYLYDLRDRTITQITYNNATDFSPSFSPDGKKLFFTTTLNGPQNIWCIEMAYDSVNKIYNKPDEMIELTKFTTGAYDPKWCGDDKIIFSTYENGNIDIKILSGVREIISKKSNAVAIKYTKKDPIETKLELKLDFTQKDLKYQKRFTFDIATTALTTDPVFGTNTGGFVSLSDMLGNEKYYFLIYSNADQQTEFWKSINIAISKISLEKRLNYAYGVFHLSGRRYDLRQSDFSYYENAFGGYLAFSYPLSFFRRVETSASLTNSTKELDFFDTRRAILLSNTISYVWDNSLWAMTGPVDGSRLNFTLGYTTDIENSSETYYSILFDARKYFRIAKYSALAVRGQFFMNEGKNPRRYFMGGSWSLRGWDRFSLRGSKLWQVNAELRFPLFDVLEFRTPIGFNLAFPGIRGALYFDAGNVWDTKENYGNTKGSIGAGIRLNFLGAIVFRYDFGKKIENNFKKLEDGLFQQFFFGWDF
jgi:Tol biopolymer transport system component